MEKEKKIKKINRRRQENRILLMEKSELREAYLRVAYDSASY